MSRELNPEEDNDLMDLGRAIHEFSFKRDEKEIAVEGMKFDIVRNDNGKIKVYEIKKSSRFELPSRMQLAYYLYRLKKEGIEAEGELLIPKEKKREKVMLDENLTRELERAISEIQRIIDQERAPEARKTRFCAKCAYAEFCWS